MISMSYLGKSVSIYLGLDWDGLYKRNAQTTAIGAAMSTT